MLTSAKDCKGKYKLLSRIPQNIGVGGALTHPVGLDMEILNQHPMLSDVSTHLTIRYLLTLKQAKFLVEELKRVLYEFRE